MGGRPHRGDPDTGGQRAVHQPSPKRRDSSPASYHSPKMVPACRRPRPTAPVAPDVNKIHRRQAATTQKARTAHHRPRPHGPDQFAGCWSIAATTSANRQRHQAARHRCNRRAAAFDLAAGGNIPMRPPQLCPRQGQQRLCSQFDRRAALSRRSRSPSGIFASNDTAQPADQ